MSNVRLAGLIGTLVLLAAAIPGQCLAQQWPGVESPLVQAAEARENATEAASLVTPAEIAFDQAAWRALSVDPTNELAVTEAGLDVEVSEQTFRFLEDALDSSRNAYVLAHIAAATGSDEAAIWGQAELDFARYSLAMARNNLAPILGIDEPDEPVDEVSPFASEGDSDAVSTASAIIIDDPRKPETVKGPDGKDYPAVPPGATGTPTDNGKGLTYPIPPNTPGLDPRVKYIRVMNPTAMYPYGYVVYMNDAKPTPQTVNPGTGQTTNGNSDPWSHIPLPPP